MYSRITVAGTMKHVAMTAGMMRAPSVGLLELISFPSDSKELVTMSMLNDNDDDNEDNDDDCD